MTTNDTTTDNLTNTELAVRLLTQGIGEKDAEVINALVRPDYIQHSALMGDGRQGLLDYVAASPPVSVDVHRVLEDGDMVALHVSYTLPDDTTLIAFDVFRVQDNQLAEHWDALQPAVPASESASGRSMVDGPTEVTDLGQTEANRALVSAFVDAFFVKGQLDRADEFISAETYMQHNPAAMDGLDSLLELFNTLSAMGLSVGYTRVPLVIAQGNMVLTGAEGFFGPSGEASYAVFYDLWRVEDGTIVEHWDVVPSPALDPAEMPHSNGWF
ncbi:MAG: nuclear transport factor 2 family protein [Myxococcota bacterium]